MLLRPGRCGDRAVPLSRIYVLSWGASLQIAPLQPQEAMIHLIANSFATQFDSDADQSRRTDFFLQRAALVKTVPVYLFRRPMDVSLPVIARTLEAHLTENSDAP